MKTSSKIALLVLLVVAGAAALLALNRPMPKGAAQGATSPSSTPVHSYSADTRPTVEVYGDSITDGNSHGFSQGDTGEESWTSYIAENGLRFMGGFAMSGLSSKDIQEFGQGGRADYVIYGIGVNDVRGAARPFEEFAENAEAFAEKQTENGAEFVVVAIGPVEGIHADLAREYNERLPRLAEEQGWIFVDPWTELRDEDYTFIGDTGRDDVHPNKEGSKIYAATLADQLLNRRGE
ncbi:SGNH/GDSL hydrolase family protein [Micrococcus luteus]|uniref:SGNH/GDSL hydrolase family protein n=1 Tax=Micrococcus luteus TaxID=1270 RepID=UPI0038799AA6